MRKKAVFGSGLQYFSAGLGSYNKNRVSTLLQTSEWNPSFVVAGYNLMKATQRLSNVYQIVLLLHYSDYLLRDNLQRSQKVRQYKFVARCMTAIPDILVFVQGDLSKLGQVLGLYTLNKY